MAIKSIQVKVTYWVSLEYNDVLVPQETMRPEVVSSLNAMFEDQVSKSIDLDKPKYEHAAEFMRRKIHEEDAHEWKYEIIELEWNEAITAEPHQG